MSAARLAAETAFSVSRQPPPEQPPTVIVRRSRGFGIEAASAGVAAGGEAGSIATSASKGPRIFRLGPSVAQPADNRASEAGRALDSPAMAAGSQFTETEEIPASRRKRRIAAEQLPGPVVQIFKAPDADEGDGRSPHGDIQRNTQRDTQPDTAGEPGPDLTRAQLATLAEMLAGVQSVLDDVQRARAFRVLDSDAARG